MGTTKLTRKEILTDDPVQAAILRLVDFFKVNGNKIGIAAAVVVLLVAGIYGGIYYLDKRDAQGQKQLRKGMDFFHAEVTPDAKEDPFGDGPNPMFRSDKEKYQAAIKEFSSLASGQSYSKLAVIARYYLGLSQLRLGQNKEAVQNLESVANNSRERTIGFLAKKALATYYFDSGNYEGAQGILNGMIKDPQCDLPKEDLSMQLSWILDAQGKRDQAIQVLKDAVSEGAEFNTFKQKVAAELEELEKASKSASKPATTRP